MDLQREAKRRDCYWRFRLARLSTGETRRLSSEVRCVRQRTFQIYVVCFRSLDSRAAQDYGCN